MIRVINSKSMEQKYHWHLQQNCSINCQYRSVCFLYWSKPIALAEPSNIIIPRTQRVKKNLSIIMISSRIEICKHYNYPPKSNQSFSLRWTFYHRYWGAPALGRKYSGCQLVLSLRHSAKASLLQLGRSWHHWKSAYVTADTRLIQIGGGKVKWRYWSHRLFVVETSSWNSNLKNRSFLLCSFFF